MPQEPAGRLVKLYYKCPDGTVVEEAALRDHLVAVLLSKLSTSADPVAAAAQIIPTAALNEVQRTTCVSTLSKFVGNVKKNPAEPKYRKIRLTNKMVHERVVAVPGATDLLRAVGFTDEDIDGEPHLVLGDEHAAALAAVADEVLAKLNAATAVEVDFAPNPQLVPPQHTTSAISLPPSFFNHTKSDVERRHDELVTAKNDELTLRTQKMRAAAKREYRFAVIRFRFPDNRMVQATFRVTDTVGTMAEVVTECLEGPAVFSLHLPGGAPGALENFATSILEADLAPSSLLTIAFEDAAHPGSLRADLPIVDD